MYRSARKRRRRLSVPVCAKLSQEIYRKVYTASLSQDRERADKIYRFLIQAFRHGPSVLDMLQLPACYDIFGLCRNVYNEKSSADRVSALFRDSGRHTGVAYRSEERYHDSLAPHFADRLPEENWVIYDENHKGQQSIPPDAPGFL